MGESISLWIPSCNGAIRVEMSRQHTTRDSGARLLREAVIDALEDHLVADPQRISHSLASNCEPWHCVVAMGYEPKIFYWNNLLDHSDCRH